MIGSYPMLHKILVVDDDERQRLAYRNLFSQGHHAILSELESFFQQDTSETLGDKLEESFLVVEASQGQEAIELVQEAYENDTPISVAFIDMRMPPGMNGLEAAEKIRAIDPRVYIVFVTAYSDVDLAQITHRIYENVLFIRKPFQSEEIEQIARNFTISWEKDRSLERLQTKLNHKVGSNLFEAAMYEISGSVLLALADKVNAQVGLTAYLASEFDVLPEQKKSYEQVTKSLFVESQTFAGIITTLQRMALSSNEVSVFSVSDLVRQVKMLVPELSNLPGNLNFKVVYKLSEDTSLHLPCNRLVIALVSMIRNSFEAIGSQMMKDPNWLGEITLVLGESDQRTLKVELIDNGIGIDSSKLTVMFKQGMTTKPGHIGIGLTVVQHLLQQVNGHVSAKSEGMGQGSSFVVNLPFTIQ